MTSAYLEVYSMHESSGSRVKIVVCVSVLYYDGACNWIKDLSGVNICVWIWLVYWNIQVLLKIWLVYPLFCCTCVLISVCNEHVFDMGADGVVDESMKDHLEWVVILGIS